MALFREIRQSARDPARFIGRKASRCRRCGGIYHYVNRAGGIVCESCEPHQGGEDCLQRLAVSGGVWVDPDDGFGVEEGEGGGDATGRQEDPRGTDPRGIDITDLTAWLDLGGRPRGSGEPHHVHWSPAMAELVAWYRLARRDGLLPDDPFDLHSPHYEPRELSRASMTLTRRVHDPESFYRHLDIEIDVQGPHGPRVACGVLERDLRRLCEIVSSVG